jgi:hypothetical protein
MLSYLAGRVDNLGGVLLALVLNNLTKSILDRRIIALYEVPIYKAHGEGGFA